MFHKNPLNYLFRSMLMNKRFPVNYKEIHIGINIHNIAYLFLKCNLDFIVYYHAKLEFLLLRWRYVSNRFKKKGDSICTQYSLTFCSSYRKDRVVRPNTRVPMRHLGRGLTVTMPLGFYGYVSRNTNPTYDLFRKTGKKNGKLKTQPLIMGF